MRSRGRWRPGRWRLLGLAALALGAIAGCGPRGDAAPQAAAPAPAGAEGTPAPARTSVAASLAVIGSVSMVVPVTQQLGLFEQHGLDVTVTYIQSGQRTAASVLAGETPIGFSGGNPVISTQASGGDLVSMALFVPRFTYEIMAGPDIQRPEQLRGGRLSSSSRGGTADMAVQYLAERWGMKIDEDFQVLVTGGIAERLAVLETGQAQAAVLEPPYSLLARRAGFHSLINLREVDYEAPSFGLIASRAWIAANEDTARRFVRATTEGVARIKTDRAAVRPVLMREYKVDDPEIVEDMLDEVGEKVMPRAPYPVAKAFENTIRNVALTTPEVAHLRAEDMVEPRFVREMEEDGFLKRLYGE
jgi:NitT/TauT family transport system substrate-binding protein